MDETIKFIPDAAYKPLFVLMFAAALWLIRWGISKIENFVKDQKTDMSQMRKDLNDLVTVSKMHEFRITTAEGDIKDLQNYKVRYQK
jgi:hypothetical protein